MSDVLETIRRLRPDVEPPDAALLEREREQLMARIAAESLRPDELRRRPAPTRRRRVLWAIALALVALIGAAAGGWALSRDSATATEVGCQFDRGSVHVIDSSTGDPVADCGAEWRRLFHSSPPALVAYDSGFGGITVVRQGSDVPSSWQRLATGFRQNTRLIELDAALGDHGGGLESGCMRLAEARRVAEGEVARLGLRNWTVVPERGAADGRTTCTAHYLDRVERRVVLFPMERLRSDAGAPYAQLARRLRALTTNTCMSVDEALFAARREARQLRLDETAGEVLFHTVDGDACARATVNVGGRVEVTIRGDAP